MRGPHGIRPAALRRAPLIGLAALAFAGPGKIFAEEAWIPDRGDGTYRNPIVHADYSDPDVVRAGDDYWMVSSSFSQVPGLPLLHSRDLVNWTLAGHALPRLVPEDIFRQPQHGKGVWAPSIRFHDGKYWIFYPDPDFGIYLVTASDPTGPWSAPRRVKSGKGLIDPCPLWDDDGQVYLVHAWAKSRAGINNRLTLLRLSADAMRVEEDLGVVVDGDKLPDYRTLEGPKLYKRNGWYYIFAPAGGVEQGWQSVFRSHQVTGPYENRIVLAQGKSPINGPHQGALVDTPAGEWWFLHFQDKGVYGRVTHLQPVTWKDDWPQIGTAAGTDQFKGEPVLVHARPALPVQPVAVPATSDEFDRPTAGPQWQWEANPAPGVATFEKGRLVLHGTVPPAGAGLTDTAHVLAQKFPAEEFDVTVKFEGWSLTPGDHTGLIVLGETCAWVGLRRAASGNGERDEIIWESRGKPGATVSSGAAGLDAASGRPVYLRVQVRAGGRCRFFYSKDGEKYFSAGQFQATAGRWVGARVGLFCLGHAEAAAKYDWIHVEAPSR